MRSQRHIVAAAELGQLPHDTYLRPNERQRVRLALLDAGSREARHSIHLTAESRPCRVCHQRGGLMWCWRCDAGRAA